MTVGNMAKLTFFWIIVVVTKNVLCEEVGTSSFTSYQKCMACTGSGKVFKLNMDNQKGSCNPFSTTAADTLFKEEKRCDILKPSFGHPKISNETACLTPINIAPTPLNVTCNCSCNPCVKSVPTVSLGSPANGNLFSRCVLCVSRKRWFIIDLQKKSAKCASSKGNADAESVAVSSADICTLLNFSCSKAL